MNERSSAVEYARMRRQLPDEFERLMWQLLKNRQRCQHKFRREHLLGIDVADVYCAAAKLVVEVDGKSHQSANARIYDSVRDQWMRTHGIRVLRFTCGQVSNETQSVLSAIESALSKIPSPPDPLSPKIRSEFDWNGEFYRPNFLGEGGIDCLSGSHCCIV